MSSRFAVDRWCLPGMLVAVVGMPIVPTALLARQGDSVPAVRRLHQIIALINAGDRSNVRSYAGSEMAPAFVSQRTEAGIVDGFSAIRFRTGGVTVASVGVEGTSRATAAVRARLSEEFDSVVVEVEATPPHRVSHVGVIAGIRADPHVAVPPDPAGRVASLDRYVRKLAEADAFSGVVLLARDGHPVYFEPFGIAHKDFAVPVRRDTRFNLGSINKSFTAVAIAQLVEQGRLSFDAPLAQFVPAFPDSVSARRIQIKHLLTHTSGLGSYFNQQFFESSRARWRTVDDLLRLASPDSLRFPPGSSWAYSNTGYLVLGKVIEVVTGKSYFDYVREQVFLPAGMLSTGEYDLDLVTPNLAVGYQREFTESGPRYRNNLFLHVIRGGPAGGGFSTAEDLLRFATALEAGRLLRQETLALVRSPKPELRSPGYGYGFMRSRGPGIWGHGGDFPGIDADLEIYEGTGYTVVVLSNYGGANDPILRWARRWFGPTRIATQ